MGGWVGGGVDLCVDLWVGGSVWMCVHMFAVCVIALCVIALYMLTPLIVSVSPAIPDRYHCVYCTSNEVLHVL